MNFNVQRIGKEVAPVVIVCGRGDFAEGISRQWRPLVCASSSCQKELQSGSDEEVAHLIFVTDTTAVSV